jgi:hypothetical protein
MFGGDYAQQERYQHMRLENLLHGVKNLDCGFLDYEAI